MTGRADSGFRPCESCKPRHIPTCLPCSQTYLRSSYTRPSRPRHVKKPLWDAALAKRRRGFVPPPQPAGPIGSESAESEVGAWAGQRWGGLGAPVLLVVGVLHPESHHTVQLLLHTLLPGLQRLPLLLHVLGNLGLEGTASTTDLPIFLGPSLLSGLLCASGHPRLQWSPGLPDLAPLRPWPGDPAFVVSPTHVQDCPPTHNRPQD